MEISAPAKGESFFRIGIEEQASGRVGAVEVASSAVRNLPPPDYELEKASSPATSTGGQNSPEK